MMDRVKASLRPQSSSSTSDADVADECHADVLHQAGLLASFWLVRTVSRKKGTLKT